MIFILLLLLLRAASYSAWLSEIVPDMYLPILVVVCIMPRWAVGLIGMRSVSTESRFLSFGDKPRRWVFYTTICKTQNNLEPGGVLR